MSKTYLIQENTLTNIADNVRSLTGVEGEISLDTMNSKLAEAKQSVDNVIGTLEGFGVEIPEGTNIGDLAGIIENSDSFGGTDTSDATAAADEIFAGETAYGPDGKVTGTFTIDNELSTQDDLISQIYTALEGKAGGSSSGGSVETCTVTLTSNSGQIKSYMFSVLENGEICMKKDGNISSPLTTPITIENVICNTGIFIAGSYTMSGFTATGGSLVIGSSYDSNIVCAQLVADANSLVTINCYNND